MVQLPLEMASERTSATSPIGVRISARTIGTGGKSSFFKMKPITPNLGDIIMGAFSGAITDLRGALKTLSELGGDLTQYWVVAQRFPQDSPIGLEIPCGRHPDSLTAGFPQTP
mgnify:CR=1 FL=1